MTFSQILEKCRSRKIAVLLDGVQANILLLLLEIREKGGPELGGVFEDGVEEVMRGIKNSLERAVGPHRFITYDEIEKMSKGMMVSHEFNDENRIKILVEKIWNGRA